MRDLSQWQPCAPPARLEVEGRTVAIVPFDAERHGEALWNAFGGADKINELTHYFPNDPFRTVDDFNAWLVAAQENWVTLVFLDAKSRRPVGMASYMRIDRKNGSIEVGSVAHGPAMARSPLSTEAHYLMARHVFDDLGYRRYEWKCHNENAPSKRTAERLGFTFEGVFRQHVISKGANRDTAWYSIIDGEWPRVKAAMERWLDPSNFTEDGRQVRSLEDIRAALVDPAQRQAS